MTTELGPVRATQEKKPMFIATHQIRCIYEALLQAVIMIRYSSEHNTKAGQNTQHSSTQRLVETNNTSNPSILSTR